MKEESLSDKFPYDDMEDSDQWVRIEDVREAVRKVKEWANKWGYKGISPTCDEELNDIFGEKLTEGEK